jgi:hypothetical protein
MTQAEFAAPPSASVLERSAAPEKRRPHYMKAEEFDKKFDDGEEDITGLLMSSGGSMWIFPSG